MGNPDEVAYPPERFALILVPIGLALALLALLPHFILPAGGRRVHRGLLIVLALFLFLHSILAPSEIGFLDGGPLEFSAPLSRHLLEWGLLAGLILLCRLESFRQVAVNLLGVLLVLLAASLFWRAATRDTGVAEREAREAAAMPSGPGLAPVLSLSREGNVIVLVLDSAQADFVEEALEADPSLRSDLDGFTFFPNHMGVAPSTTLSLPVVLSGRDYEPGDTLAAFYRRAEEPGNLRDRLQKAGYAYTTVNPYPCAAADGCYETSRFFASPESAGMMKGLGASVQLLDYALLLTAPEILKPAVYRNGRWLTVNLAAEPNTILHDRIRASISFLNVWPELLSADAPGRTYKFMDLIPTHAPYLAGPDCAPLQSLPMDNIRPDAVRTVGCSLRAVSRLFARMKELGVYDNSVIILLADTGYGLGMLDSSVGTDDRPGLGSTAARLPEGTDPAWRRLIGSANPMLMIKPVDARGPLAVNPAETDHRQVADTTCGLAPDCDPADPGNSVFLKDREAERRIFRSYYYTHDLISQPDETRLGFDEYWVTGPVRDARSWHLGAADPGDSWYRPAPLPEAEQQPEEN
jgi:hypothetical protein